MSSWGSGFSAVGGHAVESAADDQHHAGRMTFEFQVSAAGKSAVVMLRTMRTLASIATM